MTDQQHLITPPPELVEEWAHMFEQHTDTEVFSQVARWGADVELEACYAWANATGWEGAGDSLRAARRPPNLKEQVLRILEENGDTLDGRIELDPEDIDTIRRALEQLDD